MQMVGVNLIKYFKENYIESKVKKDKLIYRPKSLSGIETNNNWRQIESEYDLPKENGEYWVVYNQEIIHTYFEVGDIRFSQNGRDFYKGLPSHYQPIVKPKSPIY